ncbi:MAG: penicillin-binding transpeptidase domain-containing protein [Chthoniobacterales bacterium]
MMNLSTRTVVILALLTSCVYAGTGFPVPPSVVEKAFGGKSGTFYLIDCSTGAVSDFDSARSSERLPPCSTFKIWNLLIGIESGLVTGANEPFYRWDGEVRSIKDWNEDLTVKEAFQASCVPAFQALARKIGEAPMQDWINKIGYGDKNTSAGIDVFWLPAKGPIPILISPAEQAQLMQRLVSGEVPFSKSSQNLLAEIMKFKTTNIGTLYGKTGSGASPSGSYNLGWFVGYVRSKSGVYAFACNLQGEGASGLQARAATIAILEHQGLL